jgi:hypothetical protein
LEGHPEMAGRPRPSALGTAEREAEGYKLAAGSAASREAVREIRAERAAPAADPQPADWGAATASGRRPVEREAATASGR